ncbi:hypothetical protein OIY81_413 [Cryptosporidium canis]|uniref:Uncharacterized protein n=1 Tax=Cryptosporidium canis TaxID=195482 RepID=A0ABQ8PBG4_9CRYT|nr:hypothetical protein OIY81_413 [Cryptosporidium canis]KAJ1614692.1 hypothetical protein OJ252_533 [Cryptosporidium canis]
MLRDDPEKNRFDEYRSSMEDERASEELDNAIDVLVSEKKVWEAAFNAAKLEITEKTLEIQNLKRLLNEKNDYIQRECNRDCNLLKGPFETLMYSNKAVVNSNSTSKTSKSIEVNLLEELINIAAGETRVLDDDGDFLSKLESSSSIEDAYKFIFRTLVELSLNNSSQERRIESLNEELSATQDAVQNLQKTLQDSQNSSRLVSDAYKSQIKSLQDDLLNACKDIDFWREQCENPNQKGTTKSENLEADQEPHHQDFDPAEWCNLGSGANSLIQVETFPDSYWWFISY